MKTRNGFTIIEVLMVIMIVSCIFGLAGSLLSVGFTSYFTSGPISSNASTANIAMANVIREIENASSVTSFSSGTTLITYVNSSGSSIVISLIGTTLGRKVGAGGVQTLTANVSSAAVGFYDSALATAVALPNVRYVTLQFTVTNGNTSYPLMDGTLLRTLL